MICCIQKHKSVQNKSTEQLTRLINKTNSPPPHLSHTHIYRVTNMLKSETDIQGKIIFQRNSHFHFTSSKFAISATGKFEMIFEFRDPLAAALDDKGFHSLLNKKKTKISLYSFVFQKKNYASCEIRHFLSLRFPLLNFCVFYALQHACGIILDAFQFF